MNSISSFFYTVYTKNFIGKTSKLQMQNFSKYPFLQSCLCRWVFLVFKIYQIKQNRLDLIFMPSVVKMEN